MRQLVLSLVLFAILLGYPVAAQDTATPIQVVVTVILVWPTATETPTPTETTVPTAGPSPTATPTETATPDFVAEATVEVDGVGQDVAFVYQMDVGQFGQLIFLAFIVGLLALSLLFRAKR